MSVVEIFRQLTSVAEIARPGLSKLSYPMTAHRQTKSHNPLPRSGYDRSPMVPVGSEQERARLERVYSEMSEGELRSIATDAASLTPLDEKST
jgi:hypothetical protein